MMIAKALFWLYVLYCFEVGVFLLIFPWSNVWDQNSLLSYYPDLKIVVLNNFFRGAVSGLGLANLLLGFWEIARLNRYFRKSGGAGLAPVMLNSGDAPFDRRA